MTPRNRRRMKRPLPGSFEQLEVRIALDADGLFWGDAPYLTLSFAPDGTDVDGRPNELTQFMHRIEPDDELWQGAILSAFETWAVQTNGDVAEVAEVTDGGQPFAFGTDGDTQLDPRFGDIRIGAIPMRQNVFAVSVSRGFAAGTWSGDVFFNSTMPDDTRIDNLDELFRVALHEAGHVFGFEHNDDPTSVMFDAGIPTVSQPSVADLDELWSRFGTRLPDINERDGEWNDVQEDATHMSSSTSFDGTAPIIIHADIGVSGMGSGDDIDVYRFDPPEDINRPQYVGPVTLQVRTQGLSQLDPKIEVIRDSDGVLVASSQQQDENGQVAVTIDITGLDEGRHYVTVRAADGATSPIGSYALVATADNWLLTTPDRVDRFAGPEFRFLELDQLADIFENDPQGDIPLFVNDLHMNDTLATATPLNPLPGFEDGAKYSVVASISDQTDIDYYQIQSVDLGPNTPNVVSILVDNIEESFLDSQVELLGPNGDVLTHTNLLHHGGRTVIQLTGIEPSTTHYVRVAANEPSGPNGTGNYRLTVVAGAGETEPELFVSAVAAPNFSEYTYRAPRPQLVTFAFDGSSNSVDAFVGLMLADSSGNTVFSFDGRTDEFFTANSVMLDKGHYRLRVNHGALTGETVDFDILAAIITDPLAVPRQDSGITPIFEVRDFNEVFVFPGGLGSPPGPIIQPAIKPYSVTTLAGVETFRRIAISWNHKSEELAASDRPSASAKPATSVDACREF